MDKYLELIIKQEELIKRLESDHEKKCVRYHDRYFLNPKEFLRQAQVEGAIKGNEEHTKNLGIKHPFLESFKEYFKSPKELKIPIIVSLFLALLVSYVNFCITFHSGFNIVSNLALSISSGSAFFISIPLLSAVLLKIEQKRYNLDELKKEHEELTSELEQLKIKVAEYEAEKKAAGLEIDQLSKEIKEAKEFLNFLINQRNQALNSLSVKEALNQEFEASSEITQALGRKKQENIHE